MSKERLKEIDIKRGEIKRSKDKIIAKSFNKIQRSRGR